MKTLCTASMIVLLLFTSLPGINAQNVKEKAFLDNTEQFSIASKFVQGETYRIQVGLPASYGSSQKAYPVLYVLDGDKFFGMAKDIAECLILGGDIKDIIVIGISYGQGTDAWWVKRCRDFTIGKDTIESYKTGGADDFLKFIQYELFPVVNKTYITKQDSLAIFGHSLGGLLTAYVLFEKPELFKGIIISSPAFIWNTSRLLLEKKYSGYQKELNNSVFIDYGTLEGKSYKNLINVFIQNIQSHNYKGLRIATQTFEGETHTAVPSCAFNHGLRTLFHQ